jgi:DNA-binding response OmpR family regulator
MAKILVVDDDKSIVDLLQALLAHAGHEVVVAMDGRAGLAAAKEGKPDLIILDVMMPDMDGFTVSGLLFQDPIMRMIPVLILTAKGQSRNIFELVPNVRFYMDKPFDPPELLEKVRELLHTQSKTV